MIERVQHDLDWLEWNANAPLVVVAHSQGAEIVRRVLVGRSSPVASLVTFGSGIEKLDAVAQLRRHASARTARDPDPGRQRGSARGRG